MGAQLRNLGEVVIDIWLLYFSLFLYPLGIEGFQGAMERFENPLYKSDSQT